VVNIEMHFASVGDRTGADLPVQLHSQITSTVSVPLGQWGTIASSGSNSDRGVYSSDSTSNTKRLLQIRVLAP